jgi:hypothetical protein
VITDEELIYIAKDQQAYLNTFADGPVIRFGRALEAIIDLRYQEIISELERENQMMRARNERLEKEVKWLETLQQQAQTALLNKS